MRQGMKNSVRLHEGTAEQQAPGSFDPGARGSLSKKVQLKGWAFLRGNGKKGKGERRCWSEGN